MSKFTHEPIHDYDLAERRVRAEQSGYDVPKWVQFCEILLAEQYTLHLYEARETFSKYITVTRIDAPDKKGFKVRFSNHPPRSDRERMRDCDFFVGKTHAGTFYNTQQALDAVRKHFQMQV